MSKLVNLQIDSFIFEKSLKKLATEVINLMVGKSYSEGFNRYITSESFLHRVISAIVSKHGVMGLIIFPVTETTTTRELEDDEKTEVLSEALILLFKRDIDEDDFGKGGYQKMAKESTFEEVFTEYLFKMVEYFFNKEDLGNQIVANFLAKMRG